MITGIRKYAVQKYITKSMYIPPLLTWGVITFILGFALLARMIASTGRADISIAAFSEHVVMAEEEQFELEQDVASTLDPILELYYLQDSKSDFNLVAIVKEKIYENYVVPEQNELQVLQSEISALKQIIGSEKAGDFHSMSLEGRRLIIYFIREIFSAYGYRFLINPEGVIEEIVDPSGNTIYTMTALNTEDIHYNGLIIVLSVLVIALILCVLIAKKHQLFVKEVRYDGFNTKRYA